tara:strand:- start:239 stop:556 length:318 start_codon:yes stop_codon:yes gene_type:complete
MSSWSNTDTGGSAPLWAVARVNKAPTAANMHDSGSGASGKLFQNATEDNLITNVTIGLFNFKDGETQSGKIAHTGWNLKTTGTGGRASRIQFECLVSLANSQDAS